MVFSVVKYTDIAPVQVRNFWPLHLFRFHLLNWFILMLLEYIGATLSLYLCIVFWVQLQFALWYMYESFFVVN